MTLMLSTSEGLQDGDTRSKAPALARVIQSLAGRVRVLYELAAGRSAATGEAPAIPTNPQSLFGIDHSGPPWGSCWRHPVGGACGVKPVTADFVGQRVRGTVASGSPLELPFAIRQRPFEVGDNVPYSRAVPVIRMWRASVGSHDVTVRCGRVGSESLGREVAFTVNGTSEQTFVSADLFWEMRPFYNEDLALIFESASATVVTVGSAIMCVTEKRSY